ncbi:carbon-phosphorus lyase complex subunit PhnI [Collinsella intestinalis]|uniref:carbon-phosphorus lyase complex subunit PhnI n=1 Tax=Collinsella intestinalis TaxID=147207 RepID=UPI0025A3E3AE|nr:carbon-phosphorus lyase complex subunit PhnI [Collinsella intestinalis]MDM8162668.1 carbon-phosphorus lyase complex subunit PhnI [Collinsella intestinalis]
MGYVAVSGGEQAIAASLDLTELKRVGAGRSIEVETILAALPELVEQVESEGSLWAPEVAATAVKQALGSVEEAVFLMRAYRSTLERLYTSRVIDTDTMRVDRRISAAFKDIAGGQILGATRDYSHRLIEFELADETPADVRERAAELERALAAEPQAEAAAAQTRVPRVLTYLREIDMVRSYPLDDTEPVDITKTPLAFPAPRSVILQALSRGLTQAVIAIGYAAIRGFGLSHPTVGELRHGTVAVTIDAPGSDAPTEDDAYYLGAIPVTEVESLIVSDEVDDRGNHRSALDVGYGLVVGDDESKAIAMSVLDHSLRADDVRYPTQDQEFVLYHIDGVEATGFISHLKLPHYVTFQSKLDAALRSIAEPEKGGEADA